MEPNKVKCACGIILSPVSFKTHLRSLRHVRSGAPAEFTQTVQGEMMVGCIECKDCGSVVADGPQSIRQHNRSIKHRDAVYRRSIDKSIAEGVAAALAAMRAQSPPRVSPRQSRDEASGNESG